MFRKIIFFLILFVLIIFGLYFGLANTQTTEINLLFVKVSTSVASIVAISFTFGFFIALILSSIIKCTKACYNFVFKKGTNKKNPSSDLPASVAN